jgi:hypothetical protein
MITFRHFFAEGEIWALVAPFVKNKVAESAIVEVEGCDLRQAWKSIAFYQE